MQIDVKLSPGGDFFEAEVDGKQAGRLDLIRRGAVIVYPHTEVNPEFEGKGWAPSSSARRWTRPAPKERRSCRAAGS